MICRVTVLSFTALGRGTAPLSVIALVSAWAASVVLDFIYSLGIWSSASNLKLDVPKPPFLLVIAHLVLLISIFLSPSSLLQTTPTALILSAGITAIPVLIHLYLKGTVVLYNSAPFLPVTITLGAITTYLSQPCQIVTSQIHQITLPIATLLSAATTHLTSKFHPVSILPAILLYYGIFTVPAASRCGTLSSRHPLLRKILHKQDSSKIFTFLCLNLGFMCVQMGYGIYTNSLGLVSDSIHMMVDCAAIVFGLAASVLASESEMVAEMYHCHNNGHSHGHTKSYTHAHAHNDTHSQKKPPGKWSKLEDLAGFANGVFLVFVCLSILTEALGRLMWPEEVVEVEQLLIVSIIGLAVNLVGVFSFNHG